MATNEITKLAEALASACDHAVSSATAAKWLRGKGVSPASIYVLSATGEELITAGEAPQWFVEWLQSDEELAS